MPENQRFSAETTFDMGGMRLDQALARLFPQFSRSRLKQWLEQGFVQVDGIVVTKPREKVQGGEVVDVMATLATEVEDEAEAIPLDILHEDEAIIVINKPPGLVVHPAAGNRSGTLLNALLHHAPEVEHVPRAGIVHRLDKETSGVLVVARTLEAQQSLVKQLQSRTMKREYRALVCGRLISGGQVEAPIGRHPRHRTKMAVVDSGKEALTDYRVLERFPDHSFLAVHLSTGRTHQIRVHMSHIGHPLVGDPVYGGRLKIPKGCPETLAQALRDFKRQALHAHTLSLTHPISDEAQTFTAPLADDLQGLLQCFQSQEYEA